MKGLVLAAVAATTLAGCIAVPVHEPAPVYYSAPAYYYPAPGPSVSFYYSHRPYWRHRHYRHWH